MIACDSFKGSLSSPEANSAAAAGVRRVLPNAEIHQVPVADGGEGTMPMLVDALGGEYVTCEVYDPLMRPVTATYGICNDSETRTAIIEMAQASGLMLVAGEEKNPCITTTYGTGQLILDAYGRGCRKFIVGIGGSATNDGGAGMLQALGVRLLDGSLTDLPPGGASLLQLCAIDLTSARNEIMQCPFTIICDVDNPLTGENGASHIFAPQKGATPDDVKKLDKALSHFAGIIADVTGKDIEEIPGAGAAGGLGGAFLAFFNAQLRPGIDTTLDTIRFTEIIRGANLVITGEGKLDSQTLHGKTPCGILRRATIEGIPVVAIGGMVEDSSELCKAGFAAVFSIQQGAIPLAEAMMPDIARANISDTVEQIIHLIFHTRP